MHSSVCFSEMQVMFEIRWQKRVLVLDADDGVPMHMRAALRVECDSNVCCDLKREFGSDVSWDFRVVVNVTAIYCYKTSPEVYAFQETMGPTLLCLGLCKICVQ